MKINKKILSNILWLVYNKVFVLLLNLFVTVKIVNHYGSNEYGMYSYAVSIVAILEILITLVEVRVVKKQYQDYNFDTVVWNATFARILLSAVALFLGTVFALIYNGGFQFTVMLTILLCNAIIVNLRFGMENHFEYTLKSKKVVIASNITQLIASVLQIIAIKFDWTIISLCLISSANAIINFALIYLFYQIQYKKKLVTHLDVKLIKTIIIDSIPLAIAAAAATIYTRSDSIMLKMFIDYESVGIYAVALKLYSIAQIAIVPVRTSIFPKQMEYLNKNQKIYEKLYIKTSSIMTWFCLICCVFGNLILNKIFPLLFESEFSDAIPAFRILCIGLLFLYNSTLRTGHIALSGDTKKLMIIQIISAFLNIGLNIIFIPLLGLKGAAVATIITLFISVFVSNLFFKSIRNIFVWQLKAFNPIYIFK